MVAESRRAPLVTQDPDLLGSKVEQSRSDGSACHAILRRFCHLRPFIEEAEVCGRVASVVDNGAVHKVFALVGDMCEVLQGSPVVHRQGKRRVGSSSPARVCGNVAVGIDTGRGCGEQ